MKAKETTKEAVLQSALVLQTANKDIKEILKSANGELVSFSDLEDTKKRLLKLKRDSDVKIKKLIGIPELNTQQMEEAKEIRLKIRDTRYFLQNIEKKNTKTLNDAKNSSKDQIAQLIDIIVESENVIDTKIKEEEGRKAEERRLKEEAENNRIAAINKIINDAGIDFEKMLLTYTSLEQLEEFDKKVKEFEDKLPDLEEFEFEGHSLLYGSSEKEGVICRRGMISHRVEEAKKQKEEAARLAAEAEEQRKVTAELAEKEKELNEKAAKIEAMEKAADKTKKRIESVLALGLVFNGIDYVKEDFNVSVVELTTDDDEVFAEKLFKIQQEQIRRINADKEKAEIKTAHDNAISAYNRLTGENLPQIENPTKEQVEEVLWLIDNHNTTAEKETREKKDAEIKEAGEKVIKVITEGVKGINVSLGCGLLENEYVKDKTEDFIIKVADLITQLKFDLKQ